MVLTLLLVPLPVVVAPALRALPVMLAFAFLLRIERRRRLRAVCVALLGDSSEDMSITSESSCCEDYISLIQNSI